MLFTAPISLRRFFGLPHVLLVPDCDVASVLTGRNYCYMKYIIKGRTLFLGSYSGY